MTDLNVGTSWRLDHIEKTAVYLAWKKVDGVEGLEVYINLAKAEQELSLYLLRIHDPEYYAALVELERGDNGK